MPKLRFFETWDEVSSYVIRELLDTLHDDLGRMEGADKWHYTPSERRDMRSRIADIEALELHFPHVLRVTQAEHSTILAALRFYQKHLTGELRTIYNTPHEKAYTHDVQDIATNGAAHEPLDADAIDNLCERIN